MVNIYALINSLDDNIFYIGATIDPKVRLGTHLASAKHKRCIKSKEIIRIIELGGNVEMLILDSCRHRDAQFMEDFYMDLFKSFGFTLFQWQKSTYKADYDMVRYRVQSDKFGKYYLLSLHGNFFEEDIFVCCKLPLKKNTNPYIDADFYLKDRFINSLNFIRISYGIKEGGIERTELLERDEIKELRDSKSIIADRIKAKLRQYNSVLPEMFKDYHIFKNEIE